MSEQLEGSPVENVEKIDQAATEEEKQAQVERSEKFGIEILSDGNVTKPKEYENIPDGQFADPVNYKYPIDETHIKAALSYWGKSENKSVYNEKSQSTISERIESAAVKFNIGGRGEQSECKPEVDKEPMEQTEKQEVKKIKLTQTISTPIRILNQDKLDQEKNILPEIDGIATVVNIVNGNGQYYPKQVWDNNVPRLQQEISDGKLVGSLGHPSTGRRKETDYAIRFTELDWVSQDSNELYFKGVLIKGENGQKIKDYIDSGVNLDMSSTGWGSLVEEEVDGQNVYVVQDDFIADGFDAVLHGAATGSHISGLQQEKLMQSLNSKKEIIKQMSKEDLKKSETKPIVQEEKVEPIVQEKPEFDFEAAKQRVLEQEKALAEQMKNMSDMISTSLKTNLLQSKENVLRRYTDNQAVFTILQKKLDDSVLDSLKSVKEFDDLVQSELETLKEANLLSTTMNPGVGLVNVITDTEKERAYQEKAPSNIEQAMEPKLQELVRQGKIVDKGTNKVRHLLMSGSNKNVRRDFDDTAENMRIIISNMAEQNGMDRAADLYVGLAQNKLRKEIGLPLDQKVLHQAGEIRVADVAAANVFLYDVVYQIFPQLILPEISTIQPIDRPSAKVFYQKFKENDGDDVSKYFTEDYSDDAGEAGTVVNLDMTISSSTVNVVAKKIKCDYSIESKQDLMAYFNLEMGDMMVEGMGDQLAREWNKLCLTTMFSSCTACPTLTYGGVAPSGWTQREWQDYFWTYLQEASNSIHRARNGGATHFIAGNYATIPFSNLSQPYFIRPEVDVNTEMYAGARFLGTATNGGKVYTTNLLNDSGNNTQIMALRKGMRWSETSFIFSPFSLHMTPIIANNDMTEEIGIMDRSAYKDVDAKFRALVQYDATATGAQLTIDGLTPTS